MYQGWHLQWFKDVFDLAHWKFIPNEKQNGIFQRILIWISLLDLSKTSIKRQELYLHQLKYLLL